MLKVNLTTASELKSSHNNILIGHIYHRWLSPLQRIYLRQRFSSRLGLHSMTFIYQSAPCIELTRNLTQLWKSDITVGRWNKLHIASFDARRCQLYISSKNQVMGRCLIDIKSLHKALLTYYWQEIYEHLTILFQSKYEMLEIVFS